MIDKIGIIGLGSIGRRHLRLVRELRPSIIIVALRRREGKALPEDKIADKVVYTMVDAIADGIQAAVIATPAAYHLGQASELLRAGIHILVEKPLSISMEGINELIETREETGLVSLVGYCLRQDPSAKKFKKILDREDIGQILHVDVDCGSYLPDWRPDQDYHQSVSARKELGGGVLLELSHELDYINWFFGSIKSVSAVLQNSGVLGIEVEDSVDLILQTEGGIPVSVHLDFNTNEHRRKCIVRCSKGDLIWDIFNKKVCWKPPADPVKTDSFLQDKDEIYRLQLHHFFDCIENNKEPAVSLIDGAKVMQIVEAARESSTKGKKVTLA